MTDTTDKLDVALRVRTMLAEQLCIDVAEVTGASNLRDLDIDSLDSVELIMALEEDYQISIPDDEAERHQTVDDIIAAVRARV